MRLHANTNAFARECKRAFVIHVQYASKKTFHTVAV